jgi:hypothetical protein
MGREFVKFFQLVQLCTLEIIGKLEVDTEDKLSPMQRAIFDKSTFIPAIF